MAPFYILAGPDGGTDKLAYRHDKKCDVDEVIIVDNLAQFEGCRIFNGTVRIESGSILPFVYNLVSVRKLETNLSIEALELPLLRKLYGTIEIRSPTLKGLALPNINQIGKIVISGLNSLKKVTFNTEESEATLEISLNPEIEIEGLVIVIEDSKELSSINFNAINSLDNLKLKNLPKLKALGTKFKPLEIKSKLVISNSGLESIENDSLDIKDVIINGNFDLRTLKLNRLSNVNSIVISKNSSLKEIKLDSLSTLQGSLMIDADVEIDLTKLKELQKYKLTHEGICKSFFESLAPPYKIISKCLETCHGSVTIAGTPAQIILDCTELSTKFEFWHTTSIKKLREITGGVKIKDYFERYINFPDLKTIGGELGISNTNNIDILSALTKVGSLNIDNIRSLQINVLSNLVVDGDLTIVNTELKQILNITLGYSSSVHIFKNQGLIKINLIGTLLKEVKIKNNPALKKLSISGIRSILKSFAISQIAIQELNLGVIEVKGDSNIINCHMLQAIHLNFLTSIKESLNVKNNLKLKYYNLDLVHSIGRYLKIQDTNIKYLHLPIHYIGGNTNFKKNNNLISLKLPDLK